MKILACILSLFLLTGCWNNQELDQSALVHGIGLDKSEDSIILSMEIIKPNDSGGDGLNSGESIIIQKEAETLIEGGRESIREIKRRPYFDHNRLWIISDELAKDDFIRYLDISRRDQMFRLNSYLFITEEDPVNILSTPTLYDNLSSSEIVSALEQTKYISGYTNVKLYDFFKLIEGPIPNAYIPIIKTEKNNQQVITVLDGTAVINNGKMVGKLNDIETHGLNVFLNKAAGGYGIVIIDGSKISIEINNSETKIQPTLNGENLKAHIKVEIESTLADNTSQENVTKTWLEKVEREMSKLAEGHLQKVLNKLQKELKTDITGIGLETHKKYPKEWKKVQDRWDEVFSNAEVTIDVQTEIIHQGLIHMNKEQFQDRPRNNPFKFKRGTEEGG